MDPGTRNRFLRRSSQPVDLTPPSFEPGLERARVDPGAQIAGTRRRRNLSRKEEIRDMIKAGAIIGATILGLRLYAAIASPSPW